MKTLLLVAITLAAMVSLGTGQCRREGELCSRRGMEYPRIGEVSISLSVADLRGPPEGCVWAKISSFSCSFREKFIAIAIKKAFICKERAWNIRVFPNGDVFCRFHRVTRKQKSSSKILPPVGVKPRTSQFKALHAIIWANSPICCKFQPWYVDSWTYRFFFILNKSWILVLDPVTCKYSHITQVTP